jgi:hypothetical protein
VILLYKSIYHSSIWHNPITKNIVCDLLTFQICSIFLLQTELSRIKVPRLGTTLFYRKQFRELGYSLEKITTKWAGVLVKAGRSQVYYGLDLSSTSLGPMCEATANVGLFAIHKIVIEYAESLNFRCPSRHTFSFIFLIFIYTVYCWAVKSVLGVSFFWIILVWTKGGVPGGIQTRGFRTAARHPCSLVCLIVIRSLLDVTHKEHKWRNGFFRLSWKATSICTEDVKYADNVQEYFRGGNNNTLLS